MEWNGMRRRQTGPHFEKLVARQTNEQTLISSGESVAFELHLLHPPSNMVF